MAKNMSPQEIADKWASQAGSASESYRRGVNRVTESPTAKAAQNLNKARNNYNEAIDSGRMAARLNAVDISTWKNAASGKGASNYSTGISAGKNKMLAAMNKWTPIRNSIAASVRAMPANTAQERIQRAVAMMEGMHAAKMQGA